MNILVTGCKGQLGSEIKSISKEFPQFNFNFTDVNDLDITKSEAIHAFLEANPVDLIINCAAYTAVDKAEDDAEIVDLINNKAVEYLVKEAEQRSIKFIHISTDYVFDGNSYLPYKEDHKTNPIGVYGKTKLDGEFHVLNSSLQGMVIRTSWVYSTFGNNFVKTMIKLGETRDEISVIGDQVGTPTNARDLAYACLTIASKTEHWKSKNQIYHFSNLGVCSWYDFAYEVMNLCKIDCKVNLIETSEYPTKASRPKYSVLNKKKIITDFDLEINNWKDSLVKTIHRLKC